MNNDNRLKIPPHTYFALSPFIVVLLSIFVLLVDHVVESIDVAKAEVESLSRLKELGEALKPCLEVKP